MCTSKTQNNDKTKPYRLRIQMISQCMHFDVGDSDSIWRGGFHSRSFASRRLVAWAKGGFRIPGTARCTRAQPSPFTQGGFLSRVSDAPGLAFLRGASDRPPRCAEHAPGPEARQTAGGFSKEKENPLILTVLLVGTLSSRPSATED